MSIIEHISHPAINALGWTVFHSLWQIVLIALIWHTAMILAKNSMASLRYKMSLVALLAIPLSFIYTFVRQYAVYTSARQIVSFEFDTTAWIAAAGDRAFFLIDKDQPGFLEGLEAYTPMVFWFYLAGLLACSLHALLCYSKIYRLKRKHTRPLPASWQQKLTALIRQTGCKTSIPVKLSQKVNVPVVMGFLKPVVLLPAAMLFSMSTEHIETILLHEFYHIRRKDHYINALQNLIEILFFYHPAAWWISKHIRILREQCVDEWVVGETGSPLIYAQALVTLEKKRDAAMPQPMVAATQSKNYLFTRIKHMMTMKTRSLNTGQKLAAMLAIVFALTSIAWINPAATINLYSDAGSSAPPIDAYYQFDVSLMVDEETATDNPPALQQEKQESKPRTIYLHDGTTIQYEGLSERDREKIQQAMEEVRKAMTEVNREVFEKLHSEAFRMELQQAGEEARKAGEELRKAMEELQIELQDEAFREEMRMAREQIKEAMKELEAVDWDAIRDDIKRGMQEVDKTMKELHLEMQHIGPVLQDVMEGVGRSMEEIGKGLEQIGPVINDVMKEVQRAIEEAVQEESKSKERKQEEQ